MIKPEVRNRMISHELRAAYNRLNAVAQSISRKALRVLAIQLLES